MGSITLLDEALGNYANDIEMTDEDGGVSVVLIESRLKRIQEEGEL
ncbi:hypothetical protein C823_003716 [Eubacterium plexicaudatum ASF492]|nr:hypothetical protein C823_003716 [Eubacterium plexicaudatum ASF492]